MKYWLSHLPLEVWVDVYRYPGKSRKELGEMADKLGRKFAEYLQFYLHEWGKRTLDYLYLEKKAISPSTPLPENIKFFKRIVIWHFDSSTLAFLRQISTLFLNDVSLHFGLGANLANLRTVLDHLSQLLHGIHSMAFMGSVIPIVEQYFIAKLDQIKMLTLHFGLEQFDPARIQASINFCLNWLISEDRDPDEPRLLLVHTCCADNLQQFCIAIKQQFLLAKSPCTFAIGFSSYGNDNQANFYLENNLDEQLDGHFVEAAEYFAIYRHKKANFASAQLEEWVKGAEEKLDIGCIDIDGPVTIGQIDANDANDEVNGGVDEEEADKPSTSG